MSIPKTIKQPADWWQAFADEAARRGQTLAEFMGRAAADQLPKRIKSQLSHRAGRGKPKKVSHENP